MKHGKRPTVRQKQFISAQNLNPDNWLVTKDCPETFEIVNKIIVKNKKNVKTFLKGGQA